METKTRDRPLLIPRVALGVLVSAHGARRLLARLDGTGPQAWTRVPGSA